jgi:hypothetical protein
MSFAAWRSRIVSRKRHCPVEAVRADRVAADHELLPTIDPHLQPGAGALAYRQSWPPFLYGLMSMDLWRLTICR